MSAKTSNKLFEYIRRDQCTPEQVATWHDGAIWPTFKLLRDPSNISEIYLQVCDVHDEADGSDDLDVQLTNIAIWRENGTLTFIERKAASVWHSKRVAFAA